MRTPIRFWPSMVLACFLSSRIHAQSPSDSWSGWVRCQVDVRGPGYSDQQTHTWTMDKGAPVVQGAFHIYPGTWSVVGEGSLTRTQGSQTLQARWATNGPEISAPFAVFVRASDNRMFIRAWHAQLRNASAIQGYQQLSVSGVPTPETRIHSPAYEWGFPMIPISAPVPPSTQATASGSSTTPAFGSVGLMQPGGSAVTASCTWQFGEGSAAPAPPAALAARPVPSPGSLASNPNPPPAPAASAPAEVPTGPTPPTSPPTVPADPPASVPPPPLMVAVPLEPGLLTMPRLCQLRGPGPVPGSPSYLTPRSAHLRWTAVAGATGYTVTRSDRGVLTPQPLPDTKTSFIHEAVFPYPQSYVYTVTANYREGCGSTDITLQAPQLSTPPVGQRLGNQPGHVILIWHWTGTAANVLAVDDYDGVLITGPTLPAAGRDVKHGRGPWEQTDIYGVPAGTHTWKVKAYWDLPDGRVIDSSGRSVTSTVP